MAKIAASIGFDREKMEGSPGRQSTATEAPLTTRLHDHTVTLASSLYAAATANLVWNIAALIFFPLGIAAKLLDWSDVVIFVLNFAAIIPLAKMLDFATDQLAMRVGETLGGLLNATFGNAVELILGIVTLKAGLLTVLKATIIGSMLSNMLFVLGWCFLLAGLWPFHKNKYLSFSTDDANLNGGLLAVALLGIIIPACVTNSSLLEPADRERDVLVLSRGTAVVLMVTYVMFLVFGLYTNPDGLKVSGKRVIKLRRKADAARLAARENDREASLENVSIVGDIVPSDQPPSLEIIDDEEDEESPTTFAWVAVLLLFGTTTLIAISSEFLVDSLEPLSKQWNISERFIGIILLPLVGNAAEHVTAVFASMRGKIDLGIQVALGSTIQIALFITPVMVIVGWCIDKSLGLDFDILEVGVLFVSVFVVNSLIQDGKSHWMEGFMLLASYLIVAIVFFVAK